MTSQQDGSFVYDFAVERFETWCPMCSAEIVGDVSLDAEVLTLACPSCSCVFQIERPEEVER